MNYLKLIFIFSVLSSSVVSAKPQIYLDYKTFYTPDNKPYIETLLQFISPSFKFLANKNGNLVSSVEITQLFKIGDSVVFIDKYRINSPEMKDSTIEDYFDIKRYQLNEGIYTFEIIITDLNNNETVSGQQSVEVRNITNSKISFSSIELIQSITKTDKKNDFVKNGYFILPYLTNYFPPELTKIATYFEAYNTNHILGENEKFMLTTEIENYKTGKIIDGFFKVKKYVTGKVIPIASFLPINNLPSGDYNLVIKLIDKNNITFKTEKLFFQRRNNINTTAQISLESIDIDKSFTSTISWDSIPYYLNSLMPISARYDSKSILTLLNSEDTLKMQEYFHSFWVQTDPIQPFEAWLKYKKQVLKCQILFGTWIKKGFESDRGRVFLQYGAPNQIQDETHNSSSLPYQIWHYYRVGKRSNVRFVFYSKDITTNDFTLLHSDMLGELQNNNWQEVIHTIRGSKPPNQNVNPEDKDKQYGGQSGRYYNN